ncbi:exopolygalacturonase [Daucus carota subsp. sativus]|nr:PREDICTED: exopolygalacturonase-like [Daucus carota subsp. sativus]
MNRFDMKVVLSLVLMFSYVANGAISFGRGHYDRRALMGAPLPTGTASAGGVFDLSKCAGAKGDGVTDMTTQLNQAWKDACSSKTPAKILIPLGNWLVGELKFLGPCASPVTIEVQGTLKAKPDLASFPSGMWINIFQASGVHITGGGTLHGQGEATWKTKKPGDKAFPDSVVFSQCPNSGIENVHIVNSKGFNLKAVQSDGFKVNSVTISCGLDGSNTDGIHIAKIKDVSITNTVIGVGDDCISVGDDSVGVTIDKVTCGPGHGISIGSLGRYPDEKDVRNVAVTNSIFKNTDNGARIKTLHESPSLVASNISFIGITMDNVTNPIIIDQNYFANKPGASKVKIAGVTFKNFKGTTNSIKAVTLKCSTAVPCQGVSLTDIDLTYCGKDPAAKLTSICENVKPTVGGKMNPPGC